MELKLSKERFEEIQKLAVETPEKLSKVKKDELIDFAQDLIQVNGNSEERISELEKQVMLGKKNYDKVKSDLDQQIEFLEVANKKNTELSEKLTNLCDAEISSTGQTKLVREQYERAITLLTRYRVLSWILIIFIIIGLIF